MGAISFSLDVNLVEALKAKLSLGILVETGTFHGDTVFALKNYFSKVVSIELSRELSDDAAKRFSNDLHVEIINNNSSSTLRTLSQELADKSVLYWLDAHWCVANNTAGSESQCPLLEELKAIGSLNLQSVILIDDARLFLAPPPKPHNVNQWPMFDAILRSLKRLSDSHEVMVINDVIAFYPSSIKNEIITYARDHGVDWLEATHALKLLNQTLSDMQEKEQFIQQQAERAEQLEDIIKKQAEQLRILHLLMLIPGFNLLGRVFQRIYRIFKPRLGWLTQYQPRKMTLIDSSKSTSVTSGSKISIVTPSYGQADFIERTILSVIEQHYPNLDYYVQDGGSVDGTVDVLKKYENKLSGWVSEPDTGQSQAINRGFSHTTAGEIMAWLNSDDMLLPNTLHIVTDYFNQHPDVDVVYGNRLMIDENDMEIGRWILPRHCEKVLAWADYIPQETLFWRRSIWDKAGGEIDESFRFAMDWDLLMRFRQAGAKFAHIPRFLGAFRIHHQQKTSSVINDIGMEEMSRIRNRIHGYVPDNLEVRKNVLPFLLRHIITDLAYRIKTRLGLKVS